MQKIETQTQSNPIDTLDALARESLQQGSYISADDIAAIDAGAAGAGGFLAYGYKKQIIESSLVSQAIAEYLGMQYADMVSYPPSKELVARIPEEVGKTSRVIFFSETADTVTVATDQQSAEVPAVLQAIFPDKKIVMAYAMPEEINRALLHYRKQLQTRFLEIIEQQKQIAPEIIDQIIEDALVLRASDIHFEPQGEDAAIRLRIDGILQEAGRIGTEYYGNIVNRIKVDARLRIDEHASPQDGAIHFERGSLVADLRVSIIPTLDGEKMVIRLLSGYVTKLGLQDLGFSDAQMELIHSNAKKPFGMIIVTGPTGSGKSTTLYGLVREMNTTEVNITTIEDPVEYRIKGVNQIQANERTGLTFAKGLRSIVRQDPNIILVGEIRDAETAEIAVNAALTGHLLLSTFHANDAASAVPRLLEMGVEPFLLSSTLELVVGQRLLRKLCDSCRYSNSVKVADLEKQYPGISQLIPESSIDLYSSKGCDACNHTGYRGRVGIYEFLQTSEELREAILHSPSSAQIWKIASAQGLQPMIVDGMKKVRAGITSIEELLRVTQIPSAK